MITNTVENATLKVIDSVITMSDPSELFGGAFELSTGGESDEPGANGRVVIRGSKITAASIYVQASFDHPDGTVIIKDSTLATTLRDIFVAASATGGRDGKVRITRSDLISAEDIFVSTGIPSFVGPGGGLNGLTKVTSGFMSAAGTIEIFSGQGGRTVVRDTTLTSPSVTLDTGASGRCRSTGNIPATDCV